MSKKKKLKKVIKTLNKLLNQIEKRPKYVKRNLRSESF